MKEKITLFIFTRPNRVNKEKLFGESLNMKNKKLSKDKFNEQQIKDFYFLTRKIIKSKILTYKECAYLATMFVCINIKLSKNNCLKDVLFDRLLSLNLKVYKDKK